MIRLIEKLPGDKVVKSIVGEVVIDLVPLQMDGIIGLQARSVSWRMRRTVEKHTL